jgi:hypothetical protein
MIVQSTWLARWKMSEPGTLPRPSASPGIATTAPDGERAELEPIARFALLNRDRLVHLAGQRLLHDVDRIRAQPSDRHHRASYEIAAMDVSRFLVSGQGPGSDCAAR